MSGLLFCREMRKLNEFVPDVTFSSVCTYFLYISEEEVYTSTCLSIFYISSLFPIVLATFFVLGSFFLFTKCWKLHVPTVIPWLGSLLECSTIFPLVQDLSGHGMWFFHFLSSCLSLPPCKTHGVSPVFLCIGYKSLKCFSPLMPTNTGLAWFSKLTLGPLHQLLYFCLPLSVGMPQDCTHVLFWVLYDLIHSNNLF